MSFPYTPYETVAFTAEKLAFSGFRGLLLSELWQVIQEEFKQDKELDDFQKDTVWKWLFFDYRDEQGNEEVKFYVTYDKEPIAIEYNYQSFIAKQEQPAKLRVLPTDETQCYYLTGVSNNKKFILTLGAFPYQLLQEIARHGAKGTWASDLSEATGQDKRSMTGRLNKLEEAGLIVKEHRFYEAKRIHSTWAVHYKFGDASKSKNGDEEEDGFDHTPVKMRKFIMNSLKQAQNNIRTFRDMKVELKMNRHSQAARLFGSVIENLCDNGFIERIDVQDQAHPARKLYALRLVKDLPSSIVEGGYESWENLSTKTAQHYENIFDGDAVTEDDEHYLTASFNDIFPLTAQVYEAVKSSGTQGITAKEIVTSISGDIKHRQITRLLENNTDFLYKDGGLEALLPYPPEHRSTAIVKQSESDGRLKFYRYYSVDNFKAEVIKSHKKKRPERKVLGKSLVNLEKQFYVKIEKMSNGPLLVLPDSLNQSSKSNNSRGNVPVPGPDYPSVATSQGTAIKKRNNEQINELDSSIPKRRRLRQRALSGLGKSVSVDTYADEDASMDEVEDSSYAPDDGKHNDDDDDDDVAEVETASVKVKTEKTSEVGDSITELLTEQARDTTNTDTPSNTETFNRVFTPQISHRRKNTRFKKEAEKSKIDEADIKGAFRREQFIQLIMELGGATFTSAKLGRMLDQRIQSEKPTDIKTIARDLSKLTRTGLIEVQVIPMMQSGREINRRLIILNDPKHRPSDEFIEKTKSKSKEPISNVSEKMQMRRRLVETDYTLLNPREALKRNTTRLKSLNSKDTLHKSRTRAVTKSKSGYDNVLDFGTTSGSVSKFSGKFEDQLGEFELDTSKSKVKSGTKGTKVKRTKRKEYKGQRKNHKIKTQFEISDFTTLFRAICICKAFNKSFIDYDLVASLFKDTDTRSLKRIWVHTRKQVGGLDAVNKGVEEFERVVMKGIDEQYILVEDLENIDIAFYLDLWASFDTSKIEIHDKFPLYSTTEENLANYSKKHTFEVQADLFDLIDADSMKQKEEALSSVPFFYRVPLELPSSPLDQVKTAIKSIYRYPHMKNSRQIKEILSSYNSADIETAFTEMENEKEIVRVDEETNQYKLTEKVYAGLTSKLSVPFFKEAGLFLENVKHVVESQKGMLLSQGIEDGSVAELLYLLSSNGASLGHIDGEYVFEGYESRSMDKDALNCDLVVFKGPNNVPINQAVSKVRVPVGKPCSYIWVDTNGQIDGKLWTHIIVSLLYIIHYRPGIQAATLYEKVHSLLSVYEFAVVTRWLIDCKCIEVGDYSGIWSTPSWLSLFGYD
ncbi:TFC3 [Candida theae]|uniref:TFC3 n=1 Tax=Candida theae TaxID=1198502 RepID=A0AAD5FXH5_9ASCO|nr:TFC3 [Candida theae]KAI5953059.1 TFC3 [Candida theae]